eukprot:3180069-Amphidinium_carterae.1
MISLTSSPDVGARAGRVHAVPALEGGDGGGDDSPRRDASRDPWHGGGRDPWNSGKSNPPNHSRFGTSGAGGTGGGPS